MPSPFFPLSPHCPAPVLMTLVMSPHAVTRMQCTTIRVLRMQTCNTIHVCNFKLPRQHTITTFQHHNQRGQHQDAPINTTQQCVYHLPPSTPRLSFSLPKQINFQQLSVALAASLTNHTLSTCTSAAPSKHTHAPHAALATA